VTADEMSTRIQVLAWLDGLKHGTAPEARTALALLAALKADEWDTLVNRATQPWRRGTATKMLLTRHRQRG
jgi:hypothetical protein